MILLTTLLQDGLRSREHCRHCRCSRTDGRRDVCLLQVSVARACEDEWLHSCVHRDNTKCPCCRAGFRYSRHRGERLSWMPMTTEIMPPGLTVLKMNCVNGCGVVSTVATFDVHHRLHCPLRLQKFRDIYHQLLQDENLPRPIHSPRYKLKARCLYDGLPE